MTTSLDEYGRRRDFTKTREPSPARGRRAASDEAAPLSFVVQKHDATRLHYDFRLEMDGVLKSWAVPKGPSLDPSEKRLAMQTEDHPLAYGDFEGTIPEGEYGAGPVLLWDHGTYEPEDDDPLAALARGRLTFTLHGEKLHGRFHLVRTRGDAKARAKGGESKAWLLIKATDDDVRRGVGVDDIDARSVATGRTIEDIALAPELCTPVAAPPEGDAWLHEPKIDGYRVLAKKDGDRVQLLTRNGLDWTERFPGVAAAVAKLPPARVILDGEVAVVDEEGAADFGALQRALGAGAEGTATVYFVFDCLSLEGNDLRERPLSERKEHLARVLPKAKRARRAAIERVPFVIGHGAEFLEEMKRQRLEGMVSKRVDSPYVGERTREWLKLRLSSHEEFVVVGFTPEKKGRGLGALLVATGDGGAYRGKVGTGFTQRDRQELLRQLEPLVTKKQRAEWPRVAHATWVEPRLVVEVEYHEVTADGRLRHPVYLGVRRDKVPGDEDAARPEGILITHPERVLFHVGKTNVDKLAVAHFVSAVAPLLLPHVRGRPLAVVRCPNGSGAGVCFFQKHAMKGMPAAIKTIGVGAGEEPMLAVDDAAGLVGLVQMGVLEFHSWGAREDDPETPDRVVFDLDPAEGLGWDRVVTAARTIRAKLDARGLRSFAKVTGGKGLHVVVPLAPAAKVTTTWDDVKAFALDIAQELEREQPERYTANLKKSARTGRVFIDYLRNGRGATAIAPYSIRARPGAKVAVPVAWDELDEVRGDSFDMLNLGARLDAVDDPWADYFHIRQHLRTAAGAGDGTKRAQARSSSKPRRALPASPRAPSRATRTRAPRRG